MKAQIAPGIRRRRHAPPDGAGSISLATRVPASLKRRLRIYCAENDLDVQAFVVDAVRERLAATKRRRDASSVRGQ